MGDNTIAKQNTPADNAGNIVMGSVAALGSAAFTGGGIYGLAGKDWSNSSYTKDAWRIWLSVGSIGYGASLGLQSATCFRSLSPDLMYDALNRKLEKAAIYTALSSTVVSGVGLMHAAFSESNKAAVLPFAVAGGLITAVSAGFLVKNIIGDSSDAKNSPLALENFSITSNGLAYTVPL